MEGVLLDEKSVERLGRTVREAEADPGPGRRPDPQAVLPNWQHVRITGPKIAGGSGDSSGSGGGLAYYPGVVVVWDADQQKELVLGQVWARHLNDEPLPQGFARDMRQSGMVKLNDEIRPLFVTSAGGAGGAGQIATFLACASIQTVVL
ncbi:MAG: hypothetical protein ACJ8C4_05790 [Gemmataceae bacterium]